MGEMGAQELSSASDSLLAGGGRCVAVLLGEGDSSCQPKPFGMRHGICFAYYKSICCRTVVVTSALCANVPQMCRNTKYRK